MENNRIIPSTGYTTSVYVAIQIAQIILGSGGLCFLEFCLVDFFFFVDTDRYLPAAIPS